MKFGHSIFLVIGFSMLAQQSFAQAFYETMPVRQMYMPVQRDDGQMFNLNPATVSTGANRAAGYMLRRERSSTWTEANDEAATTKTELKESAYGAGAIFDLGSGAAAGITLERSYSDAEVLVSSSTGKPVEHMTVQTGMGRILIDLAQGLRLGLALRFSQERGDILGSANANNETERVRYTGQLVGHGGGVAFATGPFTLGAAYFPAARGKTEIISEERIISEPGVALVDVGFKLDKHMIAVGLERAVHRRDERAVTVVAEDGQGNIALDGISPDKSAFLKQTVHLAIDYSVNPNVGLRLGGANRQKEWIFSSTAIPGDSGDPEQFNYMEWRAAVHVTTPVDVLVGYQMDSHETKLTGKSGSARNGDTYKSGGKVLFISAATKF